MKTAELIWDAHEWNSKTAPSIDASSVQLILVFGERDAIVSEKPIRDLQHRYPNAKIAGASTAGTIESEGFSEYPLIATLISFDHGWVEIASIDHAGNETEQYGKALIEQFPQEHLKHIFVLSNALILDGSLLTKGINSAQTPATVTGALAGDSLEFKETVVIADGIISKTKIVAIGFYGEGIHVQISCKTGWEEFGAERIITRSEGNIIYEIDHKPAMKLYEDYLGEFINDLPNSALRFPLNIRRYAGDKEVARVMMGYNPDGSIMFAGDVPQGSTVRLMKTNATNLIDGAESAALEIHPHNPLPALAIVISCSGRRSVLRDLVDEEIESVQNSLGSQTQICGFYSYGEIAPFSDNLLDCKLHNQTMTLTVIYED